jgi:hypothetical protein
VAFDAVMSRVTTLIDAATRSGMHREQPHRPAHSAVVGTLVRPESGVEEVAGPELASENSPADAQRAQEVRDAQEARRSEAIDAMDAMDAMEDIVAKAARFLAESAPYETAPKASGRTRAPRPMVFPSVEEALVALRRAGLGEDVIGPVSEGLGRGTDLETLLLEAFARLVPAPPPPRRAGSLLVVVGAGDQARCLATTLAAEIGADPDMVPFACLDADSRAAVANRLVVHTAEEAGEFAPGWRRSRPAVVVVDAPVTSNVRSWATHLITALRPTAVWGIVDATCKTEDICSWASALGGMDALALANLGATVSPGTALGVGIPVARLDGRSATAECWAATVSDAIDRSG